MNQSKLNGIKRHLFFEFMNAIGRVFILVKYSENVVLGRRGFTAEEREKGIILVFNARMNAMWDEHGITATLVFGNAPQKCFIPTDDVVAVYSPELSAQFVVTPPSPHAGQHAEVLSSETPAGRPPGQVNSVSADYTASLRGGPSRRGVGSLAPPGGPDLSGRAGNVIKVDFSKKRREKGET